MGGADKVDEVVFETVFILGPGGIGDHDANLIELKSLCLIQVAAGDGGVVVEPELEVAVGFAGLVVESAGVAEVFGHAALRGRGQGEGGKE